MKYTIKHLRAEFGTDTRCLQFVFDNRYGKKFQCFQCKSIGKFYLIESRKRYDCVCGYSISPLSGTIFHKSSTPLTKWFQAIFLFANSRNGVAAKELERQLDVTYKCAWLIRKQISLIEAPLSFKKILLTAIKVAPKTTKIHEDYKERYNARYLVGKAIKQKIITKPAICSNCGTKKSLDGHHSDYTKPLEVNWLCRNCHAQKHIAI